MSMNIKNIIIISLSIIIPLIFFMITDSIPQDPSYHSFADSNKIININNALNVLTNLTFIIVGNIGILWLIVAYSSSKNNDNLMPYVFFFAGVVLIGLGSSYYHLYPGNFTLVWDRLPMSIAFMSLFAAVISEHIDKKTGNILLFPLIIAGVMSVIYWYYTETRGHGDLRAYITIQFLPILLIPLIVILYNSIYTRNRDLLLVLLIYLIAKVFEYFDKPVYETTGFLSGHSIKHIIAAISIYYVIRMLKLREKIISTPENN